MRRHDAATACQVGDAAGHAQDTVIRARRPVQAQHGIKQQPFALLFQLAMLFDFPVIQALVGLALACQLQGEGGRDPRGDGLGAFGGTGLAAQ